MWSSVGNAGSKHGRHELVPLVLVFDEGRAGESFISYEKHSVNENSVADIYHELLVKMLTLITGHHFSEPLWYMPYNIYFLIFILLLDNFTHAFDHIDTVMITISFLCLLFNMPTSFRSFYFCDLLVSIAGMSAGVRFIGVWLGNTMKKLQRHLFKTIIMTSSARHGAAGEPSFNCGGALIC